MRGDRPVALSGLRLVTVATPHARGSTFEKWYTDVYLGGYPACAGIDLRGCVGRDSRLWLPRMRGDRPSVTASLGRRIPATPHARGSTHEPTPSPVKRRGYPACAGIDLQGDLLCLL